MQRKQPVGQVKLTNVAIIRLKKGGSKFELACYKNKIINWRNKQETNLSEVLQIEQIFTNVSKG
jgi:ribosome maturation protein SDO1